MSEERTRDLSDTRSFEERVFARFDVMEARFEARFSSIDARLDRVEARLDSLDTRVQALEARAIDTKPIWERALTEILAIKERVENIERKFDVLTLDMMQLRGDQRRVEKRMDPLESQPQ
jgi:tetrahydromethanopterin S-methyltransferase subunit G